MKAWFLTLITLVLLTVQARASTTELDHPERLRVFSITLPGPAKNRDLEIEHAFFVIQEKMPDVIKLRGSYVRLKELVNALKTIKYDLSYERSSFDEKDVIEYVWVVLYFHSLKSRGWRPNNSLLEYLPKKGATNSVAIFFDVGFLDNCELNPIKAGRINSWALQESDLQAVSISRIYTGGIDYSSGDLDKSVHLTSNDFFSTTEGGTRLAPRDTYVALGYNFDQVCYTGLFNQVISDIYPSVGQVADEKSVSQQVPLITTFELK